MKRRFTLLSSVILILVFTLTSCFKDNDYEQTEDEDIQKFLSDNPDLNFTQKESGLYYYEETPGTGEPIMPGDTAYVLYTAKFLNGGILETSGTDTFRFPTGEQRTIPGFEEGISYMSEGTVSVLLIPSSLAYGAAGAYDQYGYMVIPGYTPLLYEVKLAEIGRAAR
jgi:FKBP-type peptidyl-prolyl cis-trans isomerase